MQKYPKGMQKLGRGIQCIKMGKRRHRNNWPPFPRKEISEAFIFLRVGKSMDVNFKPYKTGMVTVKEKYPCGRGDSKGRNHVYYLCQCDCGKEFIVSGDELSRHPYSC